MGTPDIAESCLGALLDAKLDVTCVYTRQDKPQGRKQVITPPPVKVRAQQAGIEVRQPATLKTPDAAEQLAALEPDLVVVVAYGLLLPPQVLPVPRFGCINLHVSLLPHYRGAAPIQWAVINGESETGVSIMQMDEGLDTGPVLACKRFPIAPDATAGGVFELSTQYGAELLIKTIAEIEAGRAKPLPQQGEGSYAPPLNKKMAQLGFEKPAQQLHNMVRGCNPWPLAWFEFQGSPVKVLASHVAENPGSAAPGEIISLSPLVVACGTGALVLEEVHPAGSRAMHGEAWCAGRRFAVGMNVQGE